MRRLIEKAFKERSLKTKPAAPSLPSKVTHSELVYMTTRGFIAKKLGQYMGLHTEEAEALFYLSFSKWSFEPYDEQNEQDYFVYLSEQMLKWNEQRQDIPQHIKKMDISADWQNALLKAYDMYKVPLFAASDRESPTETDKQLKHQADVKWSIYRDVIYAATQEKFQLITPDDIPLYRKGVVFCEGFIKQRSDIPECRLKAKEQLEKENIEKPHLMSWLLVLSEAITNTIKHAEEGKMTLIKDEEKQQIRFVIEDNGPGFVIEELPKMTLLAGYSTKRSMGQGFTLMMKMSEQVLLSTSPNGSVVILVFNLDRHKEDGLHDCG
ncbi:ATP-binding protein [Domibacillus enclensis]|uniref:Anti-sigma regulatory factor (Ser/Thr protein kinase) n=1 Tax=Domibacillus enclensis TaxID=1017273 RepID=A0A1N7ABD4_9BACI|nr:ATP-binding protein [Domibacillus enclensis]SIR36321.1 Anti-sigma regulatory factor (Ser/Thr protein kinase) [Domibacillus enclensis]